MKMCKFLFSIFILILSTLFISAPGFSQLRRPIPWSYYNSTDNTLATDAYVPNQAMIRAYVAAHGGGGGSATFIGLTDVPASFTGASLKLVRVNVGETALEFFTPTYLTSGGALGTPASGTLTNCTGLPLTTGVIGVLPPANGGGPQGTTITASGTVNLTTASSRQTHVATGTVTYALPTGDLSAYISTSLPPLRMGMIVKSSASTVTIDPGSGNFIAGGGAGKTLTDSVAGETYATITLQLISSATSVNTWVIVSAHGTWVSTP